MKISSIIICISILPFTIGCNNIKVSPCQKEAIELVNPFIGTGGWVDAYPGADVTYDQIRDKSERHPFGALVFPGAVAPFGMIQLSPDCNTDGFGWSAGYHYSDYSIMGFSHNHTSGNGMGFGHFLFMPCVGPIHFEPGDYSNTSSGYRSKFSHASEKAKPGYYSVFLDDYGILAELTTTPRVGIHRYTFPKESAGHIIVDLEHGLGDWANPISTQIEVLGESTILFSRTTKSGVTTFLFTQFSRSFSQLHYPGSSKSKVAIIFNDAGKEPIEIKCAISFTSKENAIYNSDSEIGTNNFDWALASTQKEWSKQLSKIKVKSDNYNLLEQFYTALYHTSLAPFLFCDVSGDYWGADKQIHCNEGFTNYTFFSLWDTYRAQHPLITLIHPERVNDMINSMLAQATFSKTNLLPIWSLAGLNSYNMAGYSATPVIADAILKKFNGFDHQKALDFMIENVQNGGFSGRDEFAKLGYVPADSIRMSVPKTLEYAYCDAAIAASARALNREKIYNKFSHSAKRYQNTFDKETLFMRPKFNNGEWKTPFDPQAVSHQWATDDYMESNAWQYNWNVMHDIAGLITLFGGNDIFVQQLDKMFDKSSYLTGRYAADVSGLVGQYAHGNEPCAHVSYLYVYAQQPWKTQERVRQIVNRTYAANPDGIPGNDDAGQLSAWLVYSLMGFYPVDPISGIYIIGTPFFEDVEIKVGDELFFTIYAKDVSDSNIYIQSATLNGEKWNNAWITHKDIIAGGQLVLQMGPVPNTQWGIEQGVPITDY